MGATLRCGARASHCGGFSCCRAWALGEQASVVVAHWLSSCRSWALEHRLSSCGVRALLLRSMWNSSRMRDRTCVPCIGRWILNHCTTREAPNLRFLTSHCTKSSVRDKVIGKKWIYSERNTLHRQSMGHLRRLERPWEKHTPQSVGHLRR